MFIEERQKDILNLLKKSGSVKVIELSQRYQVSEDSIRRDLRLLEKDGYLKRTYGGAILPDKHITMPSPYTDRLLEQQETKSYLGRLAASVISENDTIILDGSTTVSYMLPYLKQFNALTIFTNSLAIAYTLAQSQSQFEIHLLGGKLNAAAMNTLSIVTEKALYDIRVKKAFITPCAISTNNELFTSSIEEGYIKKRMMEISEQVYFMLDTSKIGSTALSCFGKLIPSHILISDIQKDSPQIEQFRSLINEGLTVIINHVTNQV